MNNYYSQHKTTKLRSKALDSNLTISLKIKWNYKILLNTSKKKKKTIQIEIWAVGPDEKFQYYKKYQLSPNKWNSSQNSTGIREVRDWQITFKTHLKE